MHVEPDPNDLKRSALDLLASGNSAHAVAEVLGVTIETVERWARDGADTTPQAVPVVHAVPAAPPAVRSAHRPAIEATGFVAQPRVTRVITIAVPLFFVALVLTTNLGGTLREAHLQWVWFLIVVGGLGLVASTIAYGLRSGFELTAHGVEWQGAWSKRELAYAEIASGSIRRNPNLELYLLKLRTRSGASGMTLWLNDEQVRQPGIADWIASLREPDDKPFVPKAAAVDSDEGGFANGLIKALFLLQLVVIGSMGLLQGSMFINDMRLVLYGPPSFESLRVTEGRLVERGSCRKPTKSAPWQSVKIDTGVVVREFGIPCVVEHGIFLKPGIRHMVIRTDERRFADHEQYAIELDGVALQSYDAHVKEKLGFAKTSALFEFVVILLVSVVLGIGGKSLLDRFRRWQS